MSVHGTCTFLLYSLECGSIYSVCQSSLNLSPVASSAGQCPQCGWHTGWCWGTLGPQTHSNPVLCIWGSSWPQPGPKTDKKSNCKLTIFHISWSMLYITKYLCWALPVVHKAGAAEGVLRFGIPAACSPDGWKSWTPASDLVHCSTDARRSLAPEHQSPWTPAPGVTSCPAGRDEVVEMELEEWHT